jgi:hypothetical protein
MNLFGVEIAAASAYRSDGIHEQGGIMSLQNRIESLKGRHAQLETRIMDEDHRPRPDTEALSRLKLEKLKVKEEMERLRAQ